MRELEGSAGMGLPSGAADSRNVLAVAFGNPHHCAILWNMNTGVWSICEMVVMSTGPVVDN